MNSQYRHKLLLVDDEVVVTQTLKRVLHRENYDIQTASSGEEALEILNESNQPFSLIISDQQMQGMSGVKFFEHAKQIFPDTIRILLTGYSEMDVIIDAVNKGKIHRYVEKPWLPDDMILQIRQSLDHYKIIRENKQLHDLTEKQNAELKELNRYLDEKVQKRTSQLKISNEKLRREMIEFNLANEARIQLSTAIEQADEIVVITDLEGNIIYVNPAFERITQYSSNQVVGQQNISILSSDNDNGIFYKQINDIVLQGDVWRGSIINKKKDGTLYHASTTISPIKSDNGKITGSVNIARDITNELKMEKKLRQAQKMESIGTLASGIAHDFNNIILVIMGYAEICLREIDETTSEYQMINKIFTASDRAKDLVSKILTFSRSKESEKKQIHITPIVTEVCTFMKSLLPKPIEIRQNIKIKNDLIFADSTQIHQILMNLCTNSGHAMKKSGGVLEISLEEILIEKNDLMSCPELELGSYLKLTVKDTGYGISKENFEHIFDPYFTTKEQDEGTGLGLAVVHGIVKEHKGDIQVFSEPGKGTSFHILLPLISEV